MRGVWIVLAAAVVACGGGSPVAPQVTAVFDDTFTLRIGQEVTFGSESLRLGFEAVAEDSRCPADAVCVWAGNAKIRLKAHVPGESQTLTLNTGVEPRIATVAGYEVRLERLEPYPYSGQEIRHERYIAHLTVSRH